MATAVNNDDIGVSASPLDLDPRNFNSQSNIFSGDKNDI